MYVKRRSNRQWNYLHHPSWALWGGWTPHGRNGHLADELVCKDSRKSVKIKTDEMSGKPLLIKFPFSHPTFITHSDPTRSHGVLSCVFNTDNSRDVSKIRPQRKEPSSKQHDQNRMLFALGPTFLLCGCFAIYPRKMSPVEISRGCICNEFLQVRFNLSS